MDIIKINNANIKHGTIVINACPANKFYQTNNNSVYNKPIISDIQSKYDNRFDDPSYYYGNATQDS